MIDIGRADALWWKLTIVLVVLFVLTLVAWAIDDRVIDRESIWAKPLKFEASLAIHFATLALALSLVNQSPGWALGLSVSAIASVAATAFEILYILVQAARQETSHFNLSIAFYSFMYVLMAAGAVVITLAAGVVGLAVLLDSRPGVSKPLNWGFVLGLVGGTILTLVTAFRMGGALNHHNGVEAAEALRMPLTGWSLTVGDRRVPHFLATHMMQAMPIAGAIAGSIFATPVAVAAVLAIAVLWTMLTLIAFAQANTGVPLTQWPFT